MIDFSQEEVALAIRLSVPGGWSDNDAESIKEKIKLDFIGRFDLCCYCRTRISHQHRMTLDIEHILPKSIYPDYTFSLDNLALACRRCNFIKADEDRFYFGPSSGNPFISDYYWFIHPNLDVATDHISIVSHQEDDSLIVKYTVKNDSIKGEYTYAYFELQKIETNTYDSAQGIQLDLAENDTAYNVPDEM